MIRRALLLWAFLLLTKPDGGRLWIDTTNNLSISEVGRVGAAPTMITTMMGVFYVRDRAEDVAKQLGWKP